MWEQQVLAELDTSVNKWIASMPKHRTSVNLTPYSHTHTKI
jgi:hypothetical protein